MDPLTAMAIATTVSGGLGAISQGSSNRAQRKAQKPAIKFQEKRNALIDQLLESIGGDGKYGDLFKSDEAAFQKSFVEPAQSMFRNQIAPQIQQQAIAGGMQGSSGLDDQLLRAGVDLDSILNQHYASFQESAKNRAFGGIGAILGTPTPGTFGAETSPLSAGVSGAQGFLGSDAFGKYLGSFGDKKKDTKSTGSTGSTGFQGTQAQLDMLKGDSTGLLAASASPRKGFGGT